MYVLPHCVRWRGVLHRRHNTYSEIKELCHAKEKAYIKYVKNNRNETDRELLNELTLASSTLITKTKNQYLSRLGEKLNDPKWGVKAYRSIINKYLGKNKVPLIPPILKQGTFFTDSEEKATLFNSFFAEQCTPIENLSTLPNFAYVTESRINTVNITEDNILSIIRSVNINKAHGYDGIMMA